MRVALPLIVLLGLATLLVAGLVFLGGGEARDAPHSPDRTGPAEPAQDLGVESAELRAPASSQELTATPGPLEPAPERAREIPAHPETALLFRVLDGRNGEPLSTFEVRLGQRFLRPLLDDEGRTRHDFPDGRVRCTGLVETQSGEEVVLAISARGFQELRVPALYVPPGRELDLGALRLERAPRIEVRVLDDRTGAPVTGARVVLLAQGSMLEPDMRPVSSDALDPFRARTDGDGRALLSSRPGEPGTLAVRHPDYAALDAELLLPLSEEHQETVRLLAPARD